MGTSQAAPAPRKKNWKTVTKDLGIKSEDVGKLVGVAASTVLPSLPEGQMTLAVFIGVKKGINFVNDVQKNGLEKAIENEGLRVTKEFIAPSISNSLWDIASSEIQNKNTPLAKIAEIAFKKTTSEIISKGAKEVISND